MPAPLIHVGPEPTDHLVQAVGAGGGRVVALEEAEGVIWDGGPDFPDFPDPVRWVQLPSAGVEAWMDAVGAWPRIRFTSAAGAYATQVAEHALALLLAGVRGIVGYARTQTWSPGGDQVLEGSTVAVVGAGGIGRELIKLLEPHDVEVIAVTRSGRDGTWPVDRLPEVWSAADHFVIGAPATDGTRHLVGADELAQMKPHAWLVNIARGSLIDPDALAEALREERIGGAALDVTDPEPLPDGHPLWSEPRALITPHVANPPETMQRDLAERVTENVRRFASGEELLAPIERGRGY